MCQEVFTRAAPVGSATVPPAEAGRSQRLVVRRRNGEGGLRPAGPCRMPISRSGHPPLGRLEVAYRLSVLEQRFPFIALPKPARTPRQPTRTTGHSVWGLHLAASKKTPDRDYCGDASAFGA